MNQEVELYCKNRKFFGGLTLIALYVMMTMIYFYHTSFQKHFYFTFSPPPEQLYLFQLSQRKILLSFIFYFSYTPLYPIPHAPFALMEYKRLFCTSCNKIPLPDSSTVEQLEVFSGRLYQYSHLFSIKINFPHLGI